MNLHDFVAESLTQIVTGVRQAQKAIADTGAVVSPEMRVTRDKESIGEAEGAGERPVYAVEFDVVVSTAAGTGTKGGIGIVVGTIALGSQGQSEAKSGNESRIRFKIPMLLPSGSRT